jgi:peroxiredoxin
MRWWTLAFAALTAALTVALALVVRENRRLREDLVVLAGARARAAGLEQGNALAPFTLRDAAGAEVHFDFAGEFLGTVLLFHASSCDACTSSRAFWRSAIEQAARPDVRVLCIQTDAVEGAPLALEGLPASLAVPLPPVGWLAAIPAVPATLVVDEHGVLTRAWYRELDADTALELAGAIAGLGATANVPPGR